MILLGSRGYIRIDMHTLCPDETIVDNQLACRLSLETSDDPAVLGKRREKMLPLQ